MVGRRRTAAPAGQVGRLRRSGRHVAGHDLQPGWIGLHRRRLDARRHPVVGRRRLRRHRGAAVEQRRRPVRRGVVLHLARRGALEQRLERRVGVGRGVAEEVVQVRSAGVPGVHDRIVGGRVAVVAVRHELRSTALRPRVARRRCVGGDLECLHRRRHGALRGRRPLRIAGARRRAHRDDAQGRGDRPSAPYRVSTPCRGATHQVAGRSGSLIAATSIVGGTSLAGRGGAVSASGMFSWAAGSGVVL